MRVLLFFALPDAVLLSATGIYSARPAAVMRSGETPKSFCKIRTIEVARLTERSQLSAVPSNLIGTLSVCPSTINSSSGLSLMTLATLPKTSLAAAFTVKLPLLKRSLSEIETYTTPFSTLI